MIFLRRPSSYWRHILFTVVLLLTFAFMFLKFPFANCTTEYNSYVSIDSSLTSTQYSESKTFPHLVGTLERPSSRYAFVCYLAPTEEEEAGKEPEHDDVYMTSVRMLIYQTQHDPATRTNNSIPFVVLVSPEVSQSKRRRLEEEGALIAEFPSIQVETLNAGRARWKHVMDKLNVFRLTQFEKVLLLDLDIVLFKPVDAIFEEPETKIQKNLGFPEQVRDDEGVQPQTYLLAADSSPIGHDKHPWPAERSKALNAGFMVLRPSQEMLEYYIKIANIPGRTPMVAPENNLLEYVHRLDGNMPFSHIRNTWIMNHPVYNDYDQGIAAVHEKWWRNSQTDLKLKEVLLRVRWKMEGYWSR